MDFSVIVFVWFYLIDSSRCFWLENIKRRENSYKKTDFICFYAVESAVNVSQCITMKRSAENWRRLILKVYIVGLLKKLAKSI